MNNKKLLHQVVKVAKEAGQFLLGIQQTQRTKLLKDADLKSDSRITKGLQKISRQIPIYSEENKEELKQGPMWIVDPIDGTFNFLHRDVFWGVSIALAERFQSQLGVVYLPALDWLVGVTRERDVIVEGNLVLGVRLDKELSEALIWIDWDKEAKITPSVFVKIGRLGLRPQVRQCCSASLLAVASGCISGFIHPRPGPEDIAAGCLMVELAGGEVTDLQNNPWNISSDSIVATNGILHEQILKGLGSII